MFELLPLPLVSQRADYTFKYNRHLGRHGWLRLTPAYSVKLVQQLMQKLPSNTVVLDPFSGTATTGLVAAEYGNHAILFDINPFLIWFGNLKCRNYNSTYLKSLEQRSHQVFKSVPRALESDNWIPAIFNIERWWSPETLKILAALRACLVDEFGEPSAHQEEDLVWIAFCRLIIETSSAAFNHVSMSFTDTVTHHDIESVLAIYQRILIYILRSCETPIHGQVQVLPIDACDIPEITVRIGKVITSPPYPNRMSYIRELRPYMYWTRFLEEAREAGEIDWKSLGGTWGIATSRLNDWQPQITDLPETLFETIDKITQSESKNSKLLATYVLKYFHDIHLHFASLRKILADGARLHYIVGNSTFFGNRVDTAKLIVTSMQSLGYTDLQIEIIRKRNCNKALYEYSISALWKS